LRDYKQYEAYIELKVPVGCGNLKTPQYLRWKGLASLAAGQPGEAIEFLKQSSLANPQNVVTDFDLGTAYWSDGRFNDATDEWRAAGASDYFLMRGREQLVSQPYTRLDLFQQVVAITPDSVEGLYELSGVYWETGNLKDFERIVEQANKLDSPPSPQKSFAMGQYYLLQNQLDQATKQFEGVLKQDPLYVPVRLFLGEIMFKQGHYQEALEYFTADEQLEPTNAWAAWWLGTTYSQLGEPSRAMEWFQQAIKLSPSMLEMIPNEYR
jgi:tetratricopeptide (TPR) repeat protein